MANSLVAEVRDLTDDELVTRLREAKEELFNLRFQVATGQLDNNRRLHTVRKDIARIYTVMRERELGIDRSGSSADNGAVTASETGTTA
jgi:large subunit ribosomal protein L29